MVASLALALPLAACDDPCPDLGTPEIEIGVGDRCNCWKDAAPGDELGIVFGPQRNHMVLISMRVRGLSVGSGESAEYLHRSFVNFFALRIVAIDSPQA